MDRKSKSFFLKILFFSAASCIVTFPLIFKMNSGIYGSFFNTDIRGGIWSLWWQKFSFFHGLNENFCNFLAIPLGIDLSQSSIFWMPFLLLKWLTILTSPLFCLNILTLASFVLAGYFVYLLVYKLIGNNTAALISGFIFAFSPFHLNKIMEFTFFSEGNWVALYVLALINLKENINRKNILYAAIALAILLNFNAYYGLFSIVFTGGLLLFGFLYQWRKKIIFFQELKNKQSLNQRSLDSRKFLKALLIVFVGAIILNIPTIIMILNKIFFMHLTLVEKESAGFIRSLDYLFAQSARPLSYLLPASTHPVFGAFTKNMFGSIFYGRGSIEQTLYLGWIPLILSFFAFKQWKHKRSHADLYPDYQNSKENFYIGFFIFSAWLAFICSMPPYIDLGLFKIYFPSYFIYKILPMFRAYARFGVIVMLCVTILASYGVKFLLEKIKHKRMKLFIILPIFLGIMFEFTNIPPFRVADLTRVPLVYSWLAKEKGDFIIAEYPIGTGAAGEAQENYDYLYYQTIHNKRMVNGALVGTKACKIKKQIIKITSPGTASILSWLGAKYVIIHLDGYKESADEASVDVIGEVPDLKQVEGFKFIKKFNDTEVYEITAMPRKPIDDEKGKND